jgi:hypothetical protein
VEPGPAVVPVVRRDRAGTYAVSSGLMLTLLFVVPFILGVCVGLLMDRVGPR